ncbi:PEGA domain-containing protein [Methanogenium organophilum]|uniref:PEGA domain-containing protein n=1 Tax=Methanogenium organophilum TaxID=2199 RepID=A0A9X9T7G1_METOG|nr:PEGA domain-containing protein [Methanogenium organophilum]WAI00371.1 PEGA domain-containing protein [Methanogenium organophilum]
MKCRLILLLLCIACATVWMTGPALADEAVVLPGEPEATILPVPTHLPGEGTSYYDIYTNVDGAAISFDGEYQGVTTGGILSVPVHTTGTPYSVVSAVKTGYNPTQRTLPPVPPEGEHTSVYLTLNPLKPVSGTLSVSSSPSGAAVYVNNVYYGITPQTVPGLTPGNHLVQITHSGYEPWSQTVGVTAGQIITVMAVLTPKQDQGTLTVRSNPSGAAIYLDSIYYGITPKTISGLVPGLHDLELTKAGYEDSVMRVRIYTDQVTTVSKSLKKISYPSTGSVQVTSNPAYASVFVNGVYYGDTKPETPLIVSGLAPGSYSVKATLTGYNDAVTSVVVNAGAATPVSFSLTPLSPDVAVASLRVTSAPSGAQVYLDNVLAGATPVTVPNIPPGVHEVRVTLTGYLEHRSSVDLSAGETASIDVNLDPAPEQSPTGIPAIIISFAICSIVLSCIFRRDKSR